MSWIVQIAGLLLILLILSDIYMTVLYPHSGVAFVSPRVSQGLWWLFRRLAALVPSRQGTILSFNGPTLLVVIALTWIVSLIIGFALIAWPALGNTIQASQGPTPTSFTTALYYSGYGLTTLGTGDIAPKSDGQRVLLVAQALMGFSVLTLTLAYLLSVYTALTRRNSFALSLHHRCDGTADASEMLARLGAGGNFSTAYQEIAVMAGDVLLLLESHNTYPVLHYFRFSEPYYAMSRIMFLVMDTATLIKSTLDDNVYTSFVQSSAVTQLWGGGLHLLDGLSQSFLPDQPEPGPPDQQTQQAWRDHYYRAVERLRAAGIATTNDLEAGAAYYVMLRQQWNTYVVAFAAYMAYEPESVSSSRRDTALKQT